MPDAVVKRLAQLPTLSRVELGHLWTQFFDASPPSQLRRDLMIPMLAYRIQEDAYGSLGGRTRSRLRELKQAFEKGGSLEVPSLPKIKPGTRLVREWGNQVHLVHVEDNGYGYKGGRYKSLSQIARLITGTRWSGPAFFGINGLSNEEVR